MRVLRELVGRIERWDAADRVAKPVVAAVGRVVRPRAVRNLLSGSFLGHPVHPMLTDLPIGAWGLATLFDTVGGRRYARTADVLVGVGVATAVPTAATGLNDWSDTQGAPRRVGLVHAAANSTALCLYVASLVARARGRRATGKVLGLTGFAVLGVGGYLGGHLAYVQGTNVNHTVWHQFPDEWTPVLADAELTAGQTRTVDVDGLRVLLVRHGDRVVALDAVCTHAGGPLDEGEVADGCVTCPWHGSQFDLADGVIVRGPASVPQPTLRTRVRAGQIEVRG